MEVRTIEYGLTERLDYVQTSNSRLAEILMERQDDLVLHSSSEVALCLQSVVWRQCLSPIELQFGRQPRTSTSQLIIIMLKFVLIYFALAVASSLSKQDCTYLYDIPNVNQVYFLHFQVKPTSNVTLCFKIPKMETQPHIAIAFNTLHSIWSGERQELQSDDNYTKIIAIPDINRPVQRGRLWRHLNDLPDSFDQMVIVHMIEQNHKLLRDRIISVSSWLIGCLVALSMYNGRLVKTHPKKE